MGGNLKKTLHLHISKKSMKPVGRNYILRPIVENNKSGILFLKGVQQNVAKVVSAPVGGNNWSWEDLVIYTKTAPSHIDEETIVVPASSIVAYYKGGVKDVKNLGILSNYVLVEITHDPSVIDLAGNEFFIDTSFKKEFHAPTYGVVRVLPNTLISHCKEVHKTNDIDVKRKFASESLPWETDMEISVGDTVHFDYLQQSVCVKDGLIIEQDGKTYFLIHYSQLYAAENGGQVWTLNGYMAVDIESEEKVDEIGSSGLITVNMKSADQRKIWGEGVVVHPGKPNRGYLLWDVDERDIPVGKGDRIVFKQTKRSKFGQDMHLRCQALKGLYRVQRKDVHFVK
jgi:hypothetical protein